MSPSSRLQDPPPVGQRTNGVSDVELDFQVPNGRVYELIKRTFDLTLALSGLILLCPLVPLIAALIKLDGPGPVLFRQKRVGKNGVPFTCYKFRSMVVNAETMKTVMSHLNEASGPAFKIRRDPRITRVGAFLRRSSLDEVPQLCNVLLGHMSIVGPRPQIPAEVELYEPWHRRRLEVKPGITCLWQISGRSHIGFDEWMRLDLEYIRRRSLRMDFNILLHTLPAVIARKGAY